MNILHSLNHALVALWMTEKQIDEDLCGRARDAIQRAQSLRHKLEQDIETEDFIRKAEDEAFMNDIMGGSL